MKNKKPRIVSVILDEKDNVKEVVIKDIAKKTGNSSYVSLPKLLTGKYLKIKIEVLR